VTGAGTIATEAQLDALRKMQQEYAGRDIFEPLRSGAAAMVIMMTSEAMKAGRVPNPG